MNHWSGTLTSLAVAGEVHSVEYIVSNQKSFWLLTRGYIKNCLSHHPKVVDLGPHFAFLGQLLPDVRTHEDGLQVDPRVLKVHPLIQSFGEEPQFITPSQGFLSYLVDVSEDK